MFLSSGQAVTHFELDCNEVQGCNVSLNSTFPKTLQRGTERWNK